VSSSAPWYRTSGFCPRGTGALLWRRPWVGPQSGSTVPLAACPCSNKTKRGFRRAESSFLCAAQPALQVGQEGGGLPVEHQLLGKVQLVQQGLGILMAAHGGDKVGIAAHHHRYALPPAVLQHLRHVGGGVYPGTGGGEGGVVICFRGRYM
jgi:hypothetical protein